MGLIEEIAAVRSGNGVPAAMVGEFRRTPLLLPIADGGAMSGSLGGVRWLYAFTGEEPLARFLLARGTETDRPWEYRVVLGARLLDQVIPELEGPVGVAVDVADEDGSMLFPPVRGIVPDAVAVDAGVDAHTPAMGAGTTAQAVATAPTEGAR
ncbi:hypothetical protein [Streptomyces sp. URMC 123]|uniref:hypothetical protein n=1 Tax=Streptomyces sp. URMC 123 TaxID=3423403 RepID=UPI003F1CD70A